MCHWNCETGVKCLDSPNAQGTLEEAFGEVLSEEPKGDWPSLKSQADGLVETKIKFYV